MLPPIPSSGTTTRLTMSRAEVSINTYRPEVSTDVTAADVTIGIPTYNRSALLRCAIESVLAQRYPHFTVIVSDNASDDNTAEVVRSFGDPRISYRPLGRNIGRTANFNRLIELTETEYVLILGDDDELHPDHLSLTLEQIKANPAIGMVHTDYSFVDQFGNRWASPADMGNGKDPILLESGARFIERSMRSGPHVHISTAVFRTAALSGGGLRPEDGVIDDFPLLMRIATRWDVGYVDVALAVARAHDGASSSALGSFTPRGFRSSRSLPDILYEHRLKFLAEAGLSEPESRRLGRIAARSYRRDVLSHLSMCATTGDGMVASLRALRTEMRRDRRLLLDPLTWRFVAGQLGGRRVRSAAQRALRHGRSRVASSLP